MNILIVGLDNSGKTSIVERMKLEEGASRGPAEVAPVRLTWTSFERTAAFTVFDMFGAAGTAACGSSTAARRARSSLS